MSLPEDPIPVPDPVFPEEPAELWELFPEELLKNHPPNIPELEPRPEPLEVWLPLFEELLVFMELLLELMLDNLGTEGTQQAALELWASEQYMRL